MIRIHNRFLKNRFERRVREINDEGATAAALDEVVSDGPATATTTATTKSPADVVVIAAKTETTGTTEQRPGQAARGTENRSTSPFSQILVSGTIDDCSSGGRKNTQVNNIDCGNTLDATDTIAHRSARRGSDVSTEDGAWYGRGSPSSSRVAEADIGTGDGITGSPSSCVVEGPSSFSGEGVARVSESCGRGGGSDGDSGGGGQDSTVAKSTTEVGKHQQNGSKRSSSRMRGIEYLFFIGRPDNSGKAFLTCREEINNQATGHHQDGGCGGCGGGITGLWGRSKNCLLRIAEDGFRLSEWSETDTRATLVDNDGPDQAAMPPPLQRSEISNGVQTSTTFSEQNNQNRHGTAVLVQHAPEAVVLFSHLLEEDILGVGTVEASGSSPSSVTTEMVDKEAAGDRELEIFAPVCSVLVVKVYTGRSQRVSPPVPSSGTSCRSRGGSSSTLGSDVLRNAWEMGFKAVCISPVGVAGEGQGDGSSRGGGGGEDKKGSTSSSSRRQV